MPSIAFNLPFLIFKVRHPVINNPAINCVGFSFYLLWGGGGGVVDS